MRRENSGHLIQSWFGREFLYLDLKTRQTDSQAPALSHLRHRRILWWQIVARLFSGKNKTRSIWAWCLSHVFFLIGIPSQWVTLYLMQLFQDLMPLFKDSEQLHSWSLTVGLANELLLRLHGFLGTKCALLSPQPWQRWRQRGRQCSGCEREFPTLRQRSEEGKRGS